MMSKILKKNNVIFLAASILLIFLLISYTKYEYIILKDADDGFSCLIRANNYTGNICMIAQTNSRCTNRNAEYVQYSHQFDKVGYRTDYSIKLCNAAYDIEYTKK
mgnify:CR=1 FL=1